MDDRAGIDGASQHGATSLAYRGAAAPGLGRLGWWPGCGCRTRPCVWLV